MADLYPWYPWYVNKWFLSQSRSMTLEQRGLYRELIDYQWNEKVLPEDEETLQRIAAASAVEWKRAWPAVRRKFEKVDGGLANLRLEEIREEQMIKAQAASAKAKKANEAKQAKRHA